MAAVAKAHPDKRIALWFQDEARVGQKGEASQGPRPAEQDGVASGGRTGHRWWVRGQRPTGLCDRRFQSAYIVAAVRPATGEDFCLVLPRVSTSAMNRFLDDFAQTVPDDTHVVMVLDGAGWRSWPGATPSTARWGGQRRYGARALRVPDNVSLVPLPAYSPDPNPVERVWLYLRERYLSHRLHANYDAVVNACCRAWNALVAEPGRIRSLCAYPYLERVTS